MITLYMICIMLFICITPSWTYHLAHVLDDNTAIEQELSKYHAKNLLKAIIKVESNFNKKAVSSKGAVGLMQIRPEIWHEELVKAGIIKSHADYFKIKENIAAGNYILTQYGKKYKCKNKVLSKYSGNARNYSKKVYNILGNQKRNGGM